MFTSKGTSSNTLSQSGKPFQDFWVSKGGAQKELKAPPKSVDNYVDKSSSLSLPPQPYLPH